MIKRISVKELGYISNMLVPEVDRFLLAYATEIPLEIRHFHVVSSGRIFVHTTIHCYPKDAKAIAEILKKNSIPLWNDNGHWWEEAK